MKILKTTIIKEGKSKVIFIKVSNQTAKVLEQVDEQSRHNYIVGEHNEVYLNDLKETRRHTSLEEFEEKGKQFCTAIPSPEDMTIYTEDINKLKKALTFLSEEQRWLIDRVFYDGSSQADMARELGVSKQAINCRLEIIFKKIKKFLKN